MLYALAIGPLVQLMLPYCIVRASGSWAGHSARKAAAVGEDDGLEPIAHTQLHQDPGDVGLDSALADVEPSGDLCVGAPVGRQESTSRSRAVRASSCGGRPGSPYGE